MAAISFRKGEEKSILQRQKGKDTAWMKTGECTM